MKCASFKAEISSVPEIQDFVKSSLYSKEKLSQKALMHVDLVIEELAMNIIKHGFKDKKKGDIYIRVKSVFDGKKLYLTIFDNGVPFNPIETKPPDIEAPITEREPGGLGVFMVKQLAESIEYSREDGKNRLYIVMLL
ncbi:MAG: ATP-binding protein [Desulfobacteraceae bacterium]